MPLVEGLAHRHERRGAEHDDLVQAGSIGLLNAIERFDPKRGEEFVAFAVPTVAGEMKRHLRDRAATVRLPRSLHEASVRLPRARDALTSGLGRVPTGAELAAEVGVSEADLAILESTIAQAEEETATEPESTAFEASEARLLVAGAFRTLDDTDRTILYLRFVQERSRREVADQLGMSQSALARQTNAALSKLRAEARGQGVRGGADHTGARGRRHARVGRAGRAQRQGPRAAQRAADASHAAVASRRARRGGGARGGQSQPIHHEHARRRCRLAH